MHISICFLFVRVLCRTVCEENTSKNQVFSLANNVSRFFLCIFIKRTNKKNIIHTCEIKCFQLKL